MSATTLLIALAEHVVSQCKRCNGEGVVFDHVRTIGGTEESIYTGCPECDELRGQLERERAART